MTADQRAVRRPFPSEEYAHRLARVRAGMQARGLDGLLVSSPENIFYLTGLDYQGYFAFQLLVVPLDGEPALITRAMERAIVRDKVKDMRYFGYSDGLAALPTAQDEAVDLVLAGAGPAGKSGGLRPWSTSLGVPTREAGAPAPIWAEPARVTVEAIGACGLNRGRIGIEKNSSLMPLGIGEAIMDGLPAARIEDASTVVSDCRLVKSARELVYTRQAAEVTDAMMLAAIAAAGPGVYKRDIMTAIYQAMFQRGGTYPGFVPLVRSTRTIEHEHGSWDDRRLARRDLLFLEMSGCIERYHAPSGRLIFIGKAPARAARIQAACEGAIEAAANRMRPGVTAGEVYAAWQARVDEAGLAGYRRHHCGYAVGIGFPPSWSGGGVPLGLRADSAMELQAGMVFHLMSWLLRTGQGDYFLSDAVVVTDHGCERLTRVPRTVTVR